MGILFIYLLFFEFQSIFAALYLFLKLKKIMSWFNVTDMYSGKRNDQYLFNVISPLCMDFIRFLAYGGRISF